MDKKAESGKPRCPVCSGPQTQERENGFSPLPSVCAHACARECVCRPVTVRGAEAATGLLLTKHSLPDQSLGATWPPCRNFPEPPSEGGSRAGRRPRLPRSQEVAGVTICFPSKLSSPSQRKMTVSFAFIFITDPWPSGG